MTTQKETLQAKDIVGYLPYKLYVLSKKHFIKYGEQTPLLLNGLAEQDLSIPRFWQYELLHEDDLKFADINEKGFKPLLYPLSHLTKEIPFNGGTIVPLIECAKKAFPLIKDFRYKHNFVKSDKAMISFYYEPVLNSFLAIDSAMQDVKVSNQHALFQLLYQYKIDFLGLIDKGLAVDVNTLTVNPYL